MTALKTHTERLRIRRERAFKRWRYVSEARGKTILNGHAWFWLVAWDIAWHELQKLSASARVGAT